MAPKSSQADDITTLKVDVGIIKNQMAEQQKVSARIEAKIDNFTFEKKADADEFKTFVAKTYVTKEEAAPYFGAMRFFIAGIAMGLITAFIAFIVRGGLIK